MQKKPKETYFLGVIGLTTALRILEKGPYQVEIIAEVIPTDPKNIKYTSHWAASVIILVMKLFFTDLALNMLGCSSC